MDETDLIVPGEFIAAEGEPASDVPPGVVLGEMQDQPPAPRLNMERPTGAEFGVSFRGAQRQNTIGGAASQAADISVARSAPAPSLDDSERTRLEASINQTDSPLQASVARRALQRKEARGTLAPSRREQAEDSLIEQIAYEMAGAFQSKEGVAGTLLGSVASFENLGGLSGLLVRQFPALASRPIVTLAADAALTNTLTDPVVQGIRLGSGAQEEYDLLQTALAPVVGAAVGGALGGAGVAVSRGLERMEMNQAIDPRLTPEDRAASLRASSEAFAVDQTLAPRTATIEGSSPVTVKQPPRSLSGEAQGALADGPFTDRTISARISAPIITQELGADIPGTLIRQLRGMPEMVADEGGIVGYHGTPYDFERFSLDKIGTGEGAQAYGYGLYFAENQNVAKQYSDNVKDMTSVRDINARLGELSKIMDGDSAGGYRKFKSDVGRNAAKEYDDLMDRRSGVVNAPGRMYEVRIKAKPEEFLDWDAPLNKQSAEVQEAIAQVGYSARVEPSKWTKRAATDQERAAFVDQYGAQIVDQDGYYSVFSSDGVSLGDSKSLPKAKKLVAELSSYRNALDGGQIHKLLSSNKPDAAAALRKLGIKGIKYLDQGSRAAGDGSRNYVVFDDNLVQITAKDGTRIEQPQALPDFMQMRGPAQGQLAAPQKVEAAAKRPASAAPEAAPVPRETSPAPDGRLIPPTDEVNLPPQAALIGQPVAAIPAHRVTTANGTSIDVAPIVVEADTLRTSQDAGYDATLQPRDRDRAASQAQIREIASRLDPERLGFSAEADRGAPIVGPDAMVESGNGRVLAIRRAYEQGGGAATRYRAWLSQQGVDLAQYREPVLVRQRMTDLAPEQRQAFTVEANQAATLTMSAGERAMADSRMLRPETLDLIRNANDLGAQGNRDFTQAFIRGLPQSEQGMMATGDGSLSSEGLTRIRNAVLAKAYSDADLMARIAEATSDDIKSISNALVAAAPDWARFRSDVEAGLVRPDMDLTASLMEAVKRTADLRAKGTTLDAFLRQQDAFDSVSAPVEAWMHMFYQPGGKRAAGGPAITERLRFFAQEARKVTSDDGLGFDLPPIRAEDVQSMAAKRGASNANAETTGNLFRSRSPSDGAGNGAGRAEAGRASTQDGGRGLEPQGDGGNRNGAGDVAAQDGEVTPDILARRRGGQSVTKQPLPNQLEAGRPKADQGTDPAADAKITRLEDISRQLVDSFETIARTGRVQPGAQGVYKTRSGVVRVRSVSDFDTLAHEVGHALHLGGGAKSDFDAIIRANVNELQQFGAGDGAAGNAEAFANLFHAYVTNLPFAQMNYPNATAALDTLMRARFPEQMKTVEGVRQMLDVLHRAPSLDVVRSDQITTQPPKFGDRFREMVAGDKDPQGRVVYSALDSLYTNSVDSNHPVYRAVENLANVAKANGKPVDLKPLDDAYVLARRLPGSHGRADAMLKYGVVPAGKVSPEGPSLSSGIEKALGKKWDAQQFEDFGAYLTARRMVAEYNRFFAGELERPPGKLSLADYQKAVADFEAANPSFKAGADDIYVFQKNHLKRQFDKGLVTKEYYETAIQRADYVPAMRDMRNFEDAEPSLPKTSAGGVGLLSRTIMKRFRGSDRPVINPLESIFKRVHDIEFVIARNDTINALARLADEAGPGAGFIYEDIPSNQLRGQRVDVMEALKSAGKTAGLDDADLTQMMLQVEDVLGDSTWATIFRQEPIKEGAEPIIYRWVNGERRAGRLGDDRFARELHHALTSMSDYEKDFLTTVLAMASGILRTGITKSPDFILTNAIRDQSTAMLTAGRKYIPFVSMAKGLVEAVKKTDEAIEFAGQGGLAGGAIVEAIQSSAFGRNVKSLQGGNWFGEVLKAFEISETGTRLGLYKSYIEQAKAMGFDDENAALYAAFKADDYIDFRKHGAAMGIPRRIFTFLNAAIQGTDREVRAAADWPVLETKRARGETLTSAELDRLKDARIGVLRLATMGVVLGGGLAFLNSENENVQNASKYWKDTNFLFSVNGTDFAIPKGFGVVQSVVNLFERGAEFSMRGDPTIATDWLEGMAKAFMMPASNPALTLMYDLPANYDRFRDRNIVPYYMQGWDAPEQYSKYTSSLARQLSTAANMVGVKLSPMKIDYTIQQLGGGMARDALFGWDVMMGTDRPEKQIYDYPVLRRFVKNLERGSRAAEDFNKLVGEKTGSYEQAENAFRGKINNGERAAASEYLRNLKEDERAWVTLNTLGFGTKAKQMHPMLNARERVALSNGMVRQLVNGNVIKEDDLDRRDLTRSRRDAEPIALTPRERALLQEEFLSYSVATARNAMVTVGAKGTTGLKPMDATKLVERIRVISPAVADEFTSRMERKNLPSAEATAAAWPEMKRRLLVDGESADLDDLIPAEVKRRARRRN